MSHYVHLQIFIQSDIYATNHCPSKNRVILDRIGLYTIRDTPPARSAPA